MTNKSVLWLFGGVVAAVLCIGTLVSTKQFIVAPFTLPTAAMEPSVKRGAIFLVLKIAYWGPASVKRGDIVAYQVDVAGRREIYLKRVIGVPGDHVTTAGPVLKINGVAVERHQVGQMADIPIFEERLGDTVYRILLARVPKGLRDADIIVPKDCFFVMGDNRMNSLDSRYIGCVRFADIIGEKL